MVKFLFGYKKLNERRLKEKQQLKLCDVGWEA